MANSDTPELMDVRSKLSFFKSQIESSSKPKTAPKPPPKRLLSQTFDSGFLNSLENSFGEKKDGVKEQEGIELNSKTRPLSQKLDKGFMKSLENSVKTSNTPIHTASVENQLPPVTTQDRTSVDKTNVKPQNNQQPSNLPHSESASLIFQKPLSPLPPAPPTPPSSQMTAAMMEIGEQYFHEINEEDEYEEEYNNSSENDHDQVANITRHNSGTRRESDDGNDPLKNLITLALLKEVIDSAVKSQQGNWFEFRSFIIFLFNHDCSSFTISAVFNNYTTS